MSSLLNLGRTLGDVSTEAFRRQYLSQALLSLDHCERIAFSYHSTTAEDGDDNYTNFSIASGKVKGQPAPPRPIAHQAGTNCLAIDPQTNRFILTGGADSTIRLWDLESGATSSNSPPSHVYQPLASLTKADQSAHSHAITSLSVYPFDAVPSTVLSTAYDNRLLLSSLTPTGLTAVHKFTLDFTPYTHTVSPASSATPLVAVGTAHTAIRLLDLRTGHASHSLPGHNGAVYGISFSPLPTKPHLLISGAADGRILLFDIRRAKPAFASLDADDAVGFQASPFADPEESRPVPQHLNWNAVAHNGPVTGIVHSHDGNHLLSAGHDGRIRLWDLASGRNELVHFGPRIRNTRNGHLAPTIMPVGFGRGGHETILWPNDDGRGEMFLSDMHEGNMLRVLRTKGVNRSNTRHSGPASTTGALAPPRVVTTKGRINQIALRYGGEGRGGNGALEVYTAHGDGSVGVWSPGVAGDQDDEVPNDEDGDDQVRDESERQAVLDAEQARRKRKRDLIGDLVQGLQKRPVTFS